MLVIRGVGEPKEVFAEFDPYVLIDMSFGPGRQFEAEKLYWRAVTGPTNLVEVGVYARDGSIASITVTNLAPERITEGMVSMDDSAQEGTPVFDTSIWPGSHLDRYDRRFVDCDSATALVVGADHVMLWLSDERSVSGWMGDRHLAFAVGPDDSFLGIRLHGLPEQDLDMLRRCGNTAIPGAEESTR